MATLAEGGGGGKASAHGGFGHSSHTAIVSHEYARKKREGKGAAADLHSGDEVLLVSFRCSIHPKTREKE